MIFYCFAKLASFSFNSLTFPDYSNTTFCYCSFIKTIVFTLVRCSDSIYGLRCVYNMFIFQIPINLLW